MSDSDVLPAPSSTRSSAPSDDHHAWVKKALGVDVKQYAKPPAASPPPTAGDGDAAAPGPSTSLASPGSNPQAQQFQASVQEQLTVIDGHLAYTAEHAAAEKHQPYAAKREVLVAAHNASLKQIDPDNPNKAKPVIDKVLAGARNQAAQAAEFRKGAEKDFNDWQTRQPRFDEAAKQIEEMQNWGHAKGPEMQSGLDAIRGQTDKRTYAEASKALDQFLPKLKPAYEDYQRQKAAQEQYEPARKELDPRLTAAQTSSFKKLEPMQQEFGPATQAMDQAAAAKDFIKALELEKDLAAKVSQYEQSLAKLQQQKKDYDDAKAPLQPKLDQNLTGPPRKPLAQMLQDLQSGAAQMGASEQAEDFVAALSTAKDLGPKVDAYIAAEAKLAEQQKAYEEALAPLQDRLAASQQSSYKALTAAQSDIAELKSKMEASAADEEYAGALDDTKELAPKLDDYEKRIKEIDAKKKQYEDAWNTLQRKLQPVGNPSHPKLKQEETDITETAKAIEKAATDEDFEGAAKMATDLGGKADSYANDVKQLEEKKKAYDNAATKVNERVGKINQTSSDPTIAAMQQAILASQAEVDKAAAAEEYEDAIKQIDTLNRQLDDYENSDATKIYVVEYKGKKYYGTQKELVAVRTAITAVAIKSVFQPLKNAAEAHTGRYKALQELNDKQYIIAWFVTGLGGAHLENVASACAAQDKAIADLQAAINGDAAKAQEVYAAAVNGVNAAGKAITIYMDALECGGDRAITGLQVVEVTCFAIAAACGGELLAPALGSVLADGAAGAGFGALEEMAKQTPEVVDGKKTVGQASIEVGKAALLNGVGALAGSKGGGMFKTAVTEEIMKRTGGKLAEKEVEKFVEGAIGNTIQAIVANSPDLVQGKITVGQFAVVVAENMIAGGLGGKLRKDLPPTRSAIKAKASTT